MSEQQIRIPIGFSPDQYDWLRAEAFRQHCPMAMLVRRAVMEYRERNDPQLRLFEQRR